MTLTNDTLCIGGRISAVDRKIFGLGWKINTDLKAPRPFCYRDFSINYGTLRNSFSRLRAANLIYVVIKGHPRFYACRGSGIRPGSMTLTHMVGGRSAALDELLLSLGDAVVAVHDIRLLFGASAFYAGLGLIPCEYSGDKRLSPMELGRGRIVKVVAHRSGSVSVLVACSNDPFPRDNLGDLLLILEMVRDGIQFKYLPTPIQVPLMGDWVVTAWHYGKDGDEIAGKRFEVTLRDFVEAFYRFYSKSTSKGRFRPRLEKIESPGKTFRELVEETLNRGSDGSGVDKVV